jgi:glucan phosphoethanolaminetransferase (alkaline phosphatase superfamily)
METNSMNFILALLTSYFGLAIFGLIFCISLVLLLVKRKTMKKRMKILLIVLAVISFAFVSFSVFLSVSFGSNHSIGIIGGSDGPTSIYIYDKLGKDEDAMQQQRQISSNDVSMTIHAVSPVGISFSLKTHQKIKNLYMVKTLHYTFERAIHGKP